MLFYFPTMLFVQSYKHIFHNCFTGIFRSRLKLDSPKIYSNVKLWKLLHIKCIKLSFYFIIFSYEQTYFQSPQITTWTRLYIFRRFFFNRSFAFETFQLDRFINYCTKFCVVTNKSNIKTCNSLKRKVLCNGRICDWSHQKIFYLLPCRVMKPTNGRG